VNTDRAVPWLTNYVETRLSEMWYPITVATLSHACRKLILKHLKLSGTPEDIDFKLVDFGYRGVSSKESAMLGGMTHLVNFKVSDTIAAVLGAQKYYGEKMAATAIPAAEHFTITSSGREHEVDAYRNMLEQFPTGPVAVVSDSYNIYDACEHLWGETLHDEVMAREGVLIIRPDSGHPPNVVLKCLEILGHKFGTTVNAKGFKVLDPHVRVIQGDGVDLKGIGDVLDRLHQYGWSADNVAFGMGGGLLQKVNRDTLSFAFKCSTVTVNGVDRPVFKCPVAAHRRATLPRPPFHRHRLWLL
jgi:nicotinamide phosphoribosyltransferase